jgi:RES domain-containing protein
MPVEKMSARVEAELGSMPVISLAWKPAVRVVPRFPPIAQLERFSDDIQAAVLAELATVDPEIIGDLRLLPSGRLPSGPGASRIITSYTFARPGRFNDEGFAAFYGADSLATAIAETVHHILEPLRDSNAPAQTLPPRLALHVDVDATDVIDARARPYPHIYEADEYTESRRFGRLVHERGHQGIVYRSVWRAGGECVAVYAPTALGECRDARELIYRYANGRIEVSEIHFASGP